jgi:hypothetical protein
MERKKKKLISDVNARRAFKLFGTKKGVGPGQPCGGPPTIEGML